MYWSYKYCYEILIAKGELSIQIMSFILMVTASLGCPKFSTNSIGSGRNFAEDVDTEYTELEVFQSYQPVQQQQ
jgi:hypothetical protein